MSLKESKIWIITGPREAGKTRFCSHLINKAHEREYTLAGVICPPVYINQQKSGFMVQNLKTGEYRNLAHLRNEEKQGLLTARWVFNEEAMDWGNQALADIKDIDLLLVDELGPLEFFQGQGWQNGLRSIDKGNYKIAVVVIRPELLKLAQKRWPYAHVLEISIDLTDEKIQNMIESILHS